MEDTNERKRLKYEYLLAECGDNRWRILLFLVEVGSREFIGQSMWKTLRALGIIGGKKVLVQRDRDIINVVVEEKVGPLGAVKCRGRDG